MRAPTMLGGAVALLLSAAIGVVPAVGDDSAETNLASGSGSEATVANDAVIPEVPADVGTVIREAVTTGGSTSADTVSAAPSAPAATVEPGMSSAPVATSPPPSVGDTPSGPAPSADPARVTGLSFLLDLLEFGAEIGPHEVTGLLVSALGTVIPTGDLPPELVTQAYTILAVPGQVFDQLADPTMQGFAAMRASLEPLAAGNEGANMLIQALSDAMIAAGTDGAALTNPLDAQVVQIGKFLIVLQEEA